MFVREIFVGRDESKLTTFNTTNITLEKVISDKASDHDFIPTKDWIGKCVQMIHAANVAKCLFSFFRCILLTFIFRYDSMWIYT